jgi:sterol desaturase/sphingolipid hydroxylase (fatty acid hydroxylase superfamily)
MLYFVFFAAGIISWTFLEYVIHRFFGHLKKGKNQITVEHQRHHREGHYFAPMWKKFLLALIVLSVSAAVIHLVAGFKQALLFATGLAGMYLLYEVTHRRLHTHEPLLRYGHVIRKHHFYHHFKDPRMNHGVTVRFWDRVFGTFVKPELVPVPQKMVLPWLIDERGELKNKFENDYTLR